ncbi:hypothetical protein GlitD10_1832 [Gloeomargarita lithophora Alchichica-D10]|uniref:Uncharacterized protein n=1 Tax=Gloeomargarita lithophora Alchichica-D10 TaxID=1188229 RepID=A0A1J0ADY5_9CYAN|nr:hypothetical protein [Gloeomargarita lithophora]APB34158.1 hypothetical protein GlitD10_1832 [Gloeomargarita lithophora Alchichica-D10]
MPANRVSAVLSKEDCEAILAAFNTIKTKLPFLIDLTKEERVALPKMGDKSRAFVTKALEVATQNPDFLPRSFDLEEMRKDTELFEAMYPILLASSQIHELIEDTVMEVGSEAYAAALVVYNYAKTSDQGAGLDGVVDEMAKRFARKSNKKNQAETPSV